MSRIRPISNLKEYFMKKYKDNFCQFSMKAQVMGTHMNCLWHITCNICVNGENCKKKFVIALTVLLDITNQVNQANKFYLLSRPDKQCF